MQNLARARKYLCNLIDELSHEIGAAHMDGDLTITVHFANALIEDLKDIISLLPVDNTFNMDEMR